MKIEEAIETLKSELNPEIYARYRKELDELEFNIGIENQEATENKHE